MRSSDSDRKYLDVAGNHKSQESQEKSSCNMLVVLFMLYLLMSSCCNDVHANGECARHALAPDASRSNDELLISYNGQTTQHVPLLNNKGAHQIVTKDLNMAIINKAVPECLLVFHDNNKDNLEMTLSSEFFLLTPIVCSLQ